MQREEGHHGAGAGRQQDPDVLARLGHGRDLAAQGEARPHQVGIAERIAILIFQDQLLGPVLVTGVKQGVEEGLLAALRVKNYRHAGETSRKRDIAPRLVEAGP